MLWRQGYAVRVARRGERGLAQVSNCIQHAVRLHRSACFCNHEPDSCKCTAGWCSFMYCGSQFRQLVRGCATRQLRRGTPGHSRESVMSSAAEDVVQKRPRAVKIGTHSGSFHCDEALGCYLLRKTAQFEGAPVTRRSDFNTYLVPRRTATWILSCAGAASCPSPRPVTARMALRTCLSKAVDIDRAFHYTTWSPTSACSP